MVEQPNIIGALAKALPDLESAKKNKANPAFKSRYADLAAVIDALEPLRSHGLWFRQVNHDCEGGVRVETFYIHESGQELSAGMTFVPTDRSNAHAYGSAQSYARRYGLQAAFGLATEDDDGNAASQPKGAANDAPRRAPVAFIDEVQITRLQMLLEATGISPVKFCQTMGCKTVSGLPADQFEVAVDRLETRLAKMAKEQTDKEAA